MHVVLLWLTAITEDLLQNLTLLFFVLVSIFFHIFPPPLTIFVYSKFYEVEFMDIQGFTRLYIPISILFLNSKIKYFLWNL